MTRARVQAIQAAAPGKALRMLRATVQNVSPLTVQILGGGVSVKALAVPGTTYTVGMPVIVFVQEPAVGPAFPLT